MELLSDDAQAHFKYFTTIMNWGDEVSRKKLFENLTLNQLMLLRYNYQYKKVLKGCAYASTRPDCLSIDEKYRYITWIEELGLVVLHSKTMYIEGNSITFDMMLDNIQGDIITLLDTMVFN